MPTGAAPPVQGAQPASLVPPGGGPLPAWPGGGSWPGGSSWPGACAHQPAQPAPAGFDPEMMGHFMQMMMDQMTGQLQLGPTSKPRGAGGKPDSATAKGRASAAAQESSCSPIPHRRRLRPHASDGSAGGGDGGRRREPDDDKKLSNKYKLLGMLWKHGEAAITPKPFRVSLCIACDSKKYQKVPLMLLQDEQVDLLCYNIGGIPPRYEGVGLWDDTERRDQIPFQADAQGFAPAVAGAARRHECLLRQSRHYRFEGRSGLGEVVTELAQCLHSYASRHSSRRGSTAAGQWRR